MLETVGAVKVTSGVSASQGTYVAGAGTTPWPTPLAMSSPLNLGVGFQSQTPHPISFDLQPHPLTRASPGFSLADQHGIRRSDTFGDIPYNPILNPDEQSQEECKSYLTTGTFSY